MAKKILALSILFLLAFSFQVYGEEEIPSLYEKALILEVMEHEVTDNVNIEEAQYVELKVLFGKCEDEFFNIDVLQMKLKESNEGII